MTGAAFREWVGLLIRATDDLAARSAPSGSTTRAVYLRAQPSKTEKIKKILYHLGLTPSEIERPPPQVRCVPVDDEGRELEDMAAEELSAP